MRITVDPDKCCGYGDCVLAAPELFDQEDGVAVLLIDEPGEEHRTDAETAAASCPVEAISVA